MSELLVKKKTVCKEKKYKCGQCVIHTYNQTQIWNLYGFFLAWWLKCENVIKETFAVWYYPTHPLIFSQIYPILCLGFVLFSHVCVVCFVELPKTNRPHIHTDVNRNHIDAVVVWAHHYTDKNRVRTVKCIIIRMIFSTFVFFLLRCMVLFFSLSDEFNVLYEFSIYSPNRKVFPVRRTFGICVTSLTDTTSK